MNHLPRILLVADLSERTREALQDVTHMHRRWGTLVDAYYMWTNTTDVDSDSPERTLRELEAFSQNEGAWDALDELGALDRLGIISIRGYLTPSESGSTLAEHASACGYLGILHGTTTLSSGTQRFEMHGRPPARAPFVPIRSVLSIAAPRRPVVRPDTRHAIAVAGASRRGRARLLAR